MKLSFWLKSWTTDQNTKHTWRDIDTSHCKLWKSVHDILTGKSKKFCQYKTHFYAMYWEIVCTALFFFSVWHLNWQVICTCRARHKSVWQDWQTGTFCDDWLLQRSSIYTWQKKSIKIYKHIITLQAQITSVAREPDFSKPNTLSFSHADASAWP